MLGYAPPFNMCGKFEVRDAEGDAQFVIQVPCVLTTCWCNQVSSLSYVEPPQRSEIGLSPPQADFVIRNMKGENVGTISKTSSNMGKEFFTDGDRFHIEFPANCPPEMKATLLGAVFLLDFLFYED